MIPRIFYRYLTALILLSWTPSSIAKEIHNLFESPRAYGRGRTYVASFDSNEASRLNPATITESDVTFQIRWFDFDLFFAQKGINKATKVANATTNSFLEETGDLFRGTNINGRGQLSFLSMRFGGFELSPFFIAKGYADLRNPSLPDVDYQADGTLGLNMVYSFQLNKTSSFGVTLRPLSRSSIGGQAGVTDLLDTNNLQDLATVVNGSGLGLDLGYIWSPSNTFRLGVTVQNLGDTGYFQDYGSEPPLIKQTINTGMLKRWQLFAGNLDFSFDYQGMLNRHGVNILRLLHIGLEQGWSVFTKDHDYGVNLGLNEGYICGGFFVDAWFVRLDFSSYGVELGHTPGQRVDRRISFSLKSSLTF